MTVTLEQVTQLLDNAGESWEGEHPFSNDAALDRFARFTATCFVDSFDNREDQIEALTHVFAMLAVSAANFIDAEDVEQAVAAASVKVAEEIKGQLRSLLEASHN